MLRRTVRIWLGGCALCLAVLTPLAGWGIASESADVWPVRNTLQYALVMRWWDVAGRPPIPETFGEGQRFHAGGDDSVMPAAVPALQLRIAGRQSVSSSVPIPGRAVRWDLTVNDSINAGRGRILLYFPPDVNENTAKLPVLLTAYPGPAEEWESASVPLAAAGYAVLAYAPPYSFTPEASVGEMRGLLEAARQGALPGVDGLRVAVLAGSYSGLHALRVMQDEHGNAAIRAAVLMGAPTDLFDMRRRLEDRSFVPPFGLDQALVALGFPDREARRYWRYSGAYHVRRGMAPMLLIHSRQDDVVPYQQSELLARAMRGEGVPYELYLMDGGSHYLLSAEVEAREVYEVTLRFLRERLG